VTAGERLAALSGLAGVSAATLLLALASGGTTGEALAAYSQLPSGTAAEHLLVEAPATQWVSIQGLAPIAKQATASFSMERSSCDSLEVLRAQADGAAIGASAYTGCGSSALYALATGVPAFVGHGVATGVYGAAVADGEVALSASSGASVGAAEIRCDGSAGAKWALTNIGAGTVLLKARGALSPSDEEIAMLAYILTRSKPRGI
jgi:hypothetical protein